MYFDSFLQASNFKSCFKKSTFRLHLYITEKMWNQLFIKVDLLETALLTVPDIQNAFTNYTCW